MLILSIRTDNPEAEIGLFDDTNKLAYEVWNGHRQLAETIHQKIAQLLKKHGKDWAGIQGVAIYKGPGSFTGLRIGISVANALASSLIIPMVGATSSNWLEDSIIKLTTGQNDNQVLPEYGSEAHITLPPKT